MFGNYALMNDAVGGQLVLTDFHLNDPSEVSHMVSSLYFVPFIKEPSPHHGFWVTCIHEFCP